MPRPNDFLAAPPARHLPAGLLRQYVAGELTPAEEHAVEAHTLECEQCAEVLEGLAMQPAAITDASLTNLRYRLHNRVAELAADAPADPIVRPLWWRPLAAAAVLLLTLGAVAWLVLRPSARPELAVQSAPKTEQIRPTSPATDDFDGAAASAKSAPTTAPQTATPGLAAAPAVVPLMRPDELSRPVPPTASLGESEGTRIAAASEATADVAEAKAPTAVTADVSTVETAAAPVADKAAASYAAAPASPAVNQAAKSRRNSEPGGTARALQSAAPVGATATPTTAAAALSGAGRTVRGRIVDTSGQPVPGVTVVVPGTSTGVSTSADGRFALALPPGSRQLTISSIGYTTQTRFLKASDSTMTLALAPDSKQLSEVVVVSREAPPALPSIGPLPAGGYAGFRQYLRDSLDYPEKAREQRVQGTVRLQFIVGTDGKLTDIKAVRRLSPECDEEAIRLLKEGPAWFPGVQNGRRTARKVELNVPFSLEKR